MGLFFLWGEKCDSSEWWTVKNQQKPHCLTFWGLLGWRTWLYTLSAALSVPLSFFEPIAVGESLWEMSDLICFAEIALNIIMKGDLKLWNVDRNLLKVILSIPSFRNFFKNPLVTILTTCNSREETYFQYSDWKMGLVCSVGEMHKNYLHLLPCYASFERIFK